MVNIWPRGPVKICIYDVYGIFAFPSKSSIFPREQRQNLDYFLVNPILSHKLWRIEHFQEIGLSESNFDHDKIIYPIFHNVIHYLKWQQVSCFSFFIGKRCFSWIIWWRAKDIPSYWRINVFSNLNSTFKPLFIWIRAKLIGLKTINK